MWSIKFMMVLISTKHSLSCAWPWLGSCWSVGDKMTWTQDQLGCILLLYALVCSVLSCARPRLGFLDSNFWWPCPFSLLPCRECILTIDCCFTSCSLLFLIFMNYIAGTRSACINAATLALADAAIPMKDLVTSCSAGYLNSTPLLGWTVSFTLKCLRIFWFVYIIFMWSHMFDFLTGQILIMSKTVLEVQMSLWEFCLRWTKWLFFRFFSWLIS